MKQSKKKQKAKQKMESVREIGGERAIYIDFAFFTGEKNKLGDQSVIPLPTEFSTTNRRTEWVVGNKRGVGGTSVVVKL